MSLLDRLFPKKHDTKKEVEEQPHIKAARVELRRASVLVQELNKVEQVMQGAKRGH